MTNEEAVSILEKMWAEVEYYEETEALDMAIKALEKQARLEELMNIGAEYADRMFDEGNGYDE